MLSLPLNLTIGAQKSLSRSKKRKEKKVVKCLNNLKEAKLNADISTRNRPTHAMDDNKPVNQLYQCHISACLKFKSSFSSIVASDAP